MYVATLPTLYGKEFVLRILDRTAVILYLDKLGHGEYVRTKIDDVLAMPNGILLVQVQLVLENDHPVCLYC